jgi:hypothetical protein
MASRDGSDKPGTLSGMYRSRIGADITRPAFERCLHPFSFLIRREFKKEHIVIANMGQKTATLDVIRMIAVLH